MSGPARVFLFKEDLDKSLHLPECSSTEGVPRSQFVQLQPSVRTHIQNKPRFQSRNGRVTNYSTSASVMTTCFRPKAKNRRCLASLPDVSFGLLNDRRSTLPWRLFEPFGTHHAHRHRGCQQQVSRASNCHHFAICIPIHRITNTVARAARLRE